MLGVVLEPPVAVFAPPVAAPPLALTPPVVPDVPPVASLDSVGELQAAMSSEESETKIIRMGLSSGLERDKASVAGALDKWRGRAATARRPRLFRNRAVLLHAPCGRDEPANVVLESRRVRPRKKDSVLLSQVAALYPRLQCATVGRGSGHLRCDQLFDEARGGPRAQFGPSALLHQSTALQHRHALSEGHCIRGVKGHDQRR